MSKTTALTRDAALVGLLECGRLLDGTPGNGETDTSPDVVYREVIQILAGIMGADRATLMLLDDGLDSLSVIASVGVPDGAAGQTRVSVSEAMQQPSVTSSVAVPISFDGGALGVLRLGRLDEAPPFSKADLQFATVAGELLGHSGSLSALRRGTGEHGLFVSQLIESIPSSMLVVDRRLRVVSANRHFLESVRRGAEATIGRRLVDVMPSWLIKYAPMEEKLREVFRSGKTIDGGDVLQVSTGNVYFFRFVPIKAGGSIRQAMLLVDDVTERHKLGVEVRRAERHLTSVVQSASDLLASLDTEDRVVTWNPAAERVSGWTVDEMRGRRLWELCPAEDAARMQTMLHEPPAEREGRTVEARLVARDGRESVVDWSSSPITDDNGLVAGTVVVGRDLTSYRLMARQLIQSEKMASLGVMAGGIAHELRTPLAVIQVSAQLLQENPDDVDLSATCLQKIEASTKRAALIIDNLLEFARPQPEALGEVDVDALLDETLALLSDQLSLQRVQVRRARMPIGARVHGNANLLQQVFTNIVLNAGNAMPEGGKLTISTSADGGQFRIAFRDTGVGIPAADLPHLFDPFFTTKPPGTPSSGLGLAISYRIAEQHSGSIDVVGEVGKGATFTVSLPVG